jgi:hypothetical protein
MRPRCLQPVQKYEIRRPRDEMDTPARDDPDPVCWRPKDHPGDRHTSRSSYERMLERSRRTMRAARRARAGMSDPGETVAA